MRHWLPLVVLASIAPVTASDMADAAVRTRVDRENEVRFTLAGKRLTATIADRRNHVRIPSIETYLFEKRVRAGCGTSFRALEPTVVVDTRHWPSGAKSLTFRFGRDISRRAKWCLMESTGRNGGGDIAFVSFHRAEPGRLLATGPSPGGQWWRLSAWRGARLEPCLRLVLAEDDFAQCLDDDAELEAELGVITLIPSCKGDTFVYGATARSAVAVAITRRDGTRSDATLYPRPAGSRVRAQYFLAVLPGVARVKEIESTGPSGEIIGRKTYSAETFERPCGLAVPD